MMKFNIYPLYRPAPSVVKNQLVRNFATKRLLFGENKTHLNVRLRELNFEINLQNTFILNRKFTSSAPLCVNEDLEKALDPYSTYAESPIESDVEGSTDKLADKFLGNPSGLIAEQTNKMESLTEKSKLFISELLQDRGLERSNLETSELEPFDKATRELIDDEGVLYQSELNRIATIRDDALDLINGRRRSHDSDYESDYESDSSLSRIQGEYANLDSNTREIENDHSRFISKALQNLPSNYANTTLDTGNHTSRDEPTSNVETNSTVDAGSSNFKEGINDLEGVTGKNLKRNREDSEVESPAKKLKVDNSGMDTNNTPDNIPSNTQSPLDYVLEKQQSDPFDFSDDID